MAEKVVILGASPKPGRFAHQALLKLKAAGHKVLPVHPKAEQIEGITVFPDLEAIQEPVDTITLYVGPARLVNMVEQLIALKPKRVIFNPGTESDEIQAKLAAENIECVVDCTLVMLDRGRY